MVFLCISSSVCKPLHIQYSNAVVIVVAFLPSLIQRDLLRLDASRRVVEHLAGVVGEIEIAYLLGVDGDDRERLLVLLVAARADL